MQPGGGRRLRRLSDRAAAAGGDAARNPDRDPRAERRDGPRQPVSGAARQRDRDRLSRRARSTAGARGQGDVHRQSGAAGGDRGGGDALSGARRRRAAPSARVRRQPGRARDGRHRAGRRSSCSSRDLRARLAIVQQAREEDHDARARRLCAARRARPRSRRSSPICRRASRRRIWSSRAPAPRRWPSSPRSAGRRSWCRCRMRSTRTSSPMRGAGEGRRRDRV